MKLSTSSNLVFTRPDGRIMPLTEMMRMGKEAGFTRFDLNFYDWSLPHSPFLTEGWRQWIDQVAEEKERLGVTFGQCHAYTYNFLDRALTEEEKERHEELVMRSLTCCHLVEATLCVTHPDTDFSAVCQTRISREKNRQYFAALLEKAAGLGLELAVENMCDAAISPRRKYGASAEELAELMDLMGDDRIGVCWDFEHGEIMKQDQEQSILLLGKHLKATHVSDTHSATDPDLMHVMPLFGKIDWKACVRALKKVNYQGDFSFEVSHYGECFPDELLKPALKLAWKIGEYLMGL